MRTSYLALVLFMSLSACEFDNYAPPESTLEGRVVFQDQPVGVRQNAVQLELWQDGYELRNEIPVHVHHDGTFTATLFDGDYKLVRKQNNGPWENNSDTIRVELRRNHTIDVPVTPYFVIQNASFQRGADALATTFRIQQIVANAELERIAFYVGTTQFVDSRFNAGAVERSITNAALDGEQSLNLQLGSTLQGRDHVFVRVAAKTRGVEEMIYTPVQKIQLR